VFRITKLKPVNRHLSLVLSPEKETDEKQSKVLLPDNYSPKKDKYTLATVVDVSSDCAEAFRSLVRSASETRRVIVDRSMIEEVVVEDRTHYLILENYVVGIIKDINED